jgi:quercetin dioxygenase-like cupin family protein
MSVQVAVKRVMQGIAVLSAAAACILPAAAAAAEDALAIAAGDAKLKWGGCPPFLPKGCALAVLHGDPAKPNVDVFLKVPGKSTIPNHTHTSAERMILVAGELHVTYEGQPMTVLKAGSYAWGPAKRAHKADCVSAKPCILFVAFEEPLDAIPVEAPAKK